MNVGDGWTLPWCPSVNHYYLHARGRMIVGKRGVAYRKAVMEAPRPEKPLDGPIGVLIRCYPPDRRARDLDNLNKCLLDALQKAGYYHNDCQIKDLQLLMEDEVIKGGRIKVYLWSIPCRISQQPSSPTKSEGSTRERRRSTPT